MPARKKNKIVPIPITCDICGTKLCQFGETLPSFKVSTYCSTEIYEHFCHDHTKDIDEFIKELKKKYREVISP